MTPDEAFDFATRIGAAWRDTWNDQARREWAEDLERLDAGTAGTAFARLKRAERHRPSIHDFLSACRALQTPANDPTGKCRLCKDSGWVFSHRTTQERQGTMPNGQPKPPLVYDFVKPCPECPNGARLAPLAARGETERTNSR